MHQIYAVVIVAETIDSFVQRGGGMVFVEALHLEGFVATLAVRGGRRHWNTSAPR